MSKKRVLNKNLERTFQGIFIPKALWLCDDFTPIQMLVMIEIHSLDGEFGCTATNEHFSEFFGVSNSTISEHISNIEKKGYITVSINELKRRDKAGTIEKVTTEAKVSNAAVEGEKAEVYNEMISNHKSGMALVKEIEAIPLYMANGDLIDYKNGRWIREAKEANEMAKLFDKTLPKGLEYPVNPAHLHNILKNT